MENQRSQGKKYVLVAEDDRFYAGVYNSKLAREGYEVKVVENGQQILEAVKERRPDLIILDMVMPVKDGYETLRELKADRASRDIPVIALSSLGQEEDAASVQGLGASGFFVKTNVTLGELMAKIKELLA